MSRTTVIQQASKEWATNYVGMPDGPRKKHYLNAALQQESMAQLSKAEIETHDGDQRPPEPVYNIQTASWERAGGSTHLPAPTMPGASRHGFKNTPRDRGA